jgi:hypothetical protein
MASGIQLATQSAPPSPVDTIRFVRHVCRMFRTTHAADFDRAVGSQASALGVSARDVYVGLFPEQVAVPHAFLGTFLPADYTPGRLAITPGSSSRGHRQAITASSSSSYLPGIDSESEAVESVESESEDEVMVVRKRGAKRKAEGEPFPMGPREEGGVL